MTLLQDQSSKTEALQFSDDLVVQSSLVILVFLPTSISTCERQIHFNLLPLLYFEIFLLQVIETKFKYIGIHRLAMKDLTSGTVWTKE